MDSLFNTNFDSTPSSHKVRYLHYAITKQLFVLKIPNKSFRNTITNLVSLSLCQEPAVRLRAHTYELEESNVKLKLTLCDTVGFGDQVNKEDSFGPVVDYVDNQFEAYLQGEILPI